MSKFDQLERKPVLHGKRWVYWLNKTKPDPEDRTTFLVCVVIENEAGYIPTGGGEADPLKAPWFWDQATCDKANQERGFSPLDAFNIVTSSMAEGRVIR